LAPGVGVAGAAGLDCGAGLLSGLLTAGATGLAAGCAGC
jgi:hypothetical protein